ncbi:MAG: DUF4390 domain-containing protein [Betaproteobacteria bacterium]|nr:DUF4390 domain-containing protein [Betaproteobacteria bacterium]
MSTVLRQLVAALALLVAAGTAWADTIAVQGARLDAVEPGYVLNAEFDFDLSSPLEEALTNGVTLSFVVEFELARPRWYWFDEKVAAERLELKLSYLPLSQQYRVTSSSDQQSFISLPEALRALGRIHRWQVIGRERVTPGIRYVGAVRMRLDTSQLPKAFTLSAITNREWTLASERRRLDFSPPEREPR